MARSPSFAPVWARCDRVRKRRIGAGGSPRDSRREGVRSPRRDQVGVAELVGYLVRGDGGDVVLRAVIVQRVPERYAPQQSELARHESQRGLDEADEIAHLLDRLVGGLLPRPVVPVLPSKVLEGLGVGRRQMWYQVFPVDVTDHVPVTEGVRGARVGELR